MATLPPYPKRCVWCGEGLADWDHAPTWGECDECRAWWEVLHAPTLAPPLAFPVPRFPLKAKVRYIPLREAWADVWQRALPWRVVGCSVERGIFAQDRITYVIQPWHLTGQWRMHDIPLVVEEGQLALWEEGR